MSEVKVNKISPRSGTTVTLGDSGDTFTIPSGATINNQGTAVNFGATGSASWVTTVKTGDFTAVAGEGYFVNTTSGTITVTLPSSPAAGAVVAVSDYAGTADTNNITIGRNGSNINGAASDQIVSKENSAVTLVYVDGTQGWKATDTSNLNDIELQPEYIVATGGTITCSGNFKIHTFTGPGTFTVNSVGNPLGSTSVDYLVVAGGAAGGANGGGGGGAGGFRLSNSTCMPGPQTSPLATPTALTVTATSFPITVGGGGAQSPGPPAPDGDDGSNSVFSTITSSAGGGGGGTAPGQRSGRPGGSAGGGTYVSNTGGGTGNTPPVSPPQGNNGGTGCASAPVPPGLHSGGGGGASVVGGPGNSPVGGTGGTGSFVVSTGFAGCNGTTGPVSGARYFSGGGAGSPGDTSGTSAGGTGGGAPSQHPSPAPSRNGTTNTGGGGGGGPGGPACGGAGGSGIVIIRYKYQ